jgi:multisubunit Na+/H+ antiporter MnhB subunit
MIMKIAAVAGSLVLLFIFANVALELPVFGSPQNKDIATYYTWHGLQDTGSANIVNSIVWDYRGYDTLGEETVLFSAALGVFLVMGGLNGRNNEDD